MSLRKNGMHGVGTALFLAILVIGGALPAPTRAADEASRDGWFTVLWGDDSTGATIGPFYHLTEDSGQVTQLLLNETIARPLGGVLSLNNKYVSIQGAEAASRAMQGPATVFSVTSISLAQSPAAKAMEGDVSPAVSGARPWVSIMCKFSDITDEPKNLAYFQGMYGNTKPGMNHYWREVSNNIANVAGSTASGWFVLPHPKAYYNPSDTQGGANLDLLATECIAAADASVNFALYSGINMMFNTNFDNGYAWGGSRYMTLDGASKSWSVTWEPPWGYADITVIAHEMGHGFGLPHSSGAYGQTYDNQWDVMSDSWSNCARSRDTTYGCLGQHTISYYKDKLGWIPADKKFTVGQNTQANLTLEQLALPATGDYTMAKIPIAGSTTHFYSVEVRRQGGYDYKLPSQGVIVHEVDTARSRPAYVVDSDGNGNTGDAGAIWTVGETFADAANKIYVSVLSATATGFQVSIRLGDMIAGDVDASGAVDMKDIIRLLQIMSGISPVGTINPNADVNADGKLGLVEAIYVMKQLAQ